MENLLSSLNSIPEYSIAVVVYLLGSFIALWCWYGVAIRMPRLIGGVTWLIMFAILLTPTVSAGSNAALAPAVFGFIFGLLTKDQPLMWANLSYMLLTLGLGLVVGYLYHLYRQNKAQTRQNNNTPL